MVRCPNCGSTAQMKLKMSDYYGKYLIEKWGCSCGCVVERKLEEVDHIITFPNGGVKYEKYENYEK